LTIIKLFNLKSQGATTLLLIYFALMLSPPSEVVTIMHTSIIITALFSRIFFKEKLTIAHFIAIILSLNGVLLISQPEILFGKKNSRSNDLIQLNLTNQTVLVDKNNKNSMENLHYGILLAFFISFMITFVFLLIKKLCNSKVHWVRNSKLFNLNIQT
jgi:drug/metabolite transporter (DMT)-like permease